MMLADIYLIVGLIAGCLFGILFTVLWMTRRAAPTNNNLPREKT